MTEDEVVGWHHRLDGNKFLVSPEELPASNHLQLPAAPLAFQRLNARPLGFGPL